MGSVHRSGKFVNSQSEDEEVKEVKVIKSFMERVKIDKITHKDDKNLFYLRIKDVDVHNMTEDDCVSLLR
jgi:hypothetical protein